MKQSLYFLPTLRDVPADAEAKSHQLMIRAGLIRQLASGVYTYLPLGYEVIKKIIEIIREEMDAAGAQELLMPTLQPAELWQQTGRWDNYGKELMRLKDRHDRDFALGPTHEEVITSLVRDEIKTYKKLPVNLYQIQTKFRDEYRPRFGVLRAREFIMKDAYSFDTSEEGLDQSYRSMVEAYNRIFTRCGLNFRAVEADSGAIGGKDTQEFMVLAEIGEDTIAYCTECNYAANIEKAEVSYRPEPSEAEPAALEKVATPGVRTIAEVSAFLKVPEKKIIKSVLFLTDGQPVLVLVRGDHEVNEVKVKNLIGAETIELADEKTVQELLGAVPGFIGPVGANGVKIVADHAVKDLVNAVAGANEADAHLVGVQPGRDFDVDQYGDLRTIQEGDVCPRCGGKIAFARGIEVGHVFKLRTKYSEALGATFLDEHGKQQTMIMGCYGIGVSRLVAAIIEQHHDDDGIIWPAEVAPFQVHIVPIHYGGGQQEIADKLYRELKDQGLDVLLDDRNERPGVKFKDSDLIGIPLRIVVGGKAEEEGRVEIKVRRTKETYSVAIEEVPARVKELLKNL